MKNASPRAASLAGAVLAILAATLAPTAALAVPPAKEPTCAGIKDAYDVLGIQCGKQYEKITHNPGNAKDRLASYKARIAVMEIFRKAYLCNGMFGATSKQQEKFKLAEPGHLQAIAALNINMINQGDPNVPAVYTANDLDTVKITKINCK
ncbi:hypothetical protein [Usitatibacter palustris]|uniref:Secreted protein n=1 Tax=Usitatibacter palustris TaxID=2732487 RepID=A0A6M4H7D9_9PROT|nr:hypothetical protein [Usitatibacter palustris]QJR15085.1 hypothetical protein DSM104440_01901 [Usitatibacter palustris]